MWGPTISGYGAAAAADGSRGYAPYGLDTDAAALGFDRIVVEGEIGVAIAHHRRTDTSTRATIFLHGAAGSWTTWTPLLRAAAETETRITNPVVLDLPGWGEGELTHPGPAVDIAAVCAIVKECAEELGFTEWDIIGHSMGGFIAMHMASLWPQSVLSVGVVSGTGESIVRSVTHPLRNFRELPAFTIFRAGMAVLTAFGPVGTALFRGLRALGALPLLTRPLFAHPRQMPRSVITALGDELRPGAFTLASSLVGGYDLAESWGRIECPVRALNGDQDVFSTAEDLRRIGELTRTSVLTVVAECGHFAAVERPHTVLVALGYR